jgi:hypothetical protein
MVLLYIVYSFTFVKVSPNVNRYCQCLQNFAHMLILKQINKY